MLSTAAVVLVLKLWVSATTFGTNDVRYWESFAAAVRRVGPINIYGVSGGWWTPGREPSILAAPYNHPPLIGWLLIVLNHLARFGFSFPFLIRVPASVADVVTTVLIFEMLRVRRGLRAATAAAILVACSPVLFIISGFHGNTDPVFVMFILLSAYLLINRPWPAMAWASAALAGVAFALGLSVKLVPIVVLPTLLLLAAHLGRRQLASFVLGAGLVIVPALGTCSAMAMAPVPRGRARVRGDRPASMGARTVRETAACSGQRGYFPPGPWTLPRTGGQRPAAALLLCWRRDAALPAIGLSLALFLLLSPAFGTQYLVWPVAAAYFIDFWAATAYNLLAGALLAEVYNRWNGGLPWDVAKATPLLTTEVWAAGIVWTMLLLVVIVGTRNIARRTGTKRPPPNSAGRRGIPAYLRRRKPDFVSRRGAAAIAGGSPGVPARLYISRRAKSGRSNRTVSDNNARPRIGILVVAYNAELTSARDAGPCSGGRSGRGSPR